MQANAVIFDFFGVICSEVAPVWLARHLSASDAAKIKGEVVGAADRGLVSQADMFARLAQITGVAAQRVETEWYALARIDERIVQLVRTTGGRMPVGLLTNAPAEFVRSLLCAHELDGLFGAIAVSSELGCAKPDKKIYEIMLAMLKCDARSSVMIDDNVVNVDGAIAAGMAGLVYSSFEQLEEYIRSRVLAA